MSDQEGESEAVRDLQAIVESYPCPSCGTIQPDMVAGPKAWWHGLLAALSLVPLAVLLAFGTGTLANNGPSTDTCSLLAGGVAVVFAGLHLSVVLYNPNSKLKVNQLRAEHYVTAFRMERVKSGGIVDLTKVPTSLGLGQSVVLIVQFLSALAMLAAVFLRTMHGWPRNTDLRPELLGPGDVVRAEMPARHVLSAKGNWQGEATAVVLNATELGTPSTLPVSCHAGSWRDFLGFRPDGNAVPIYPWVHLTLPDEEAIGGRTLRIRVYLFITYAASSMEKGKPTEKTVVSRDLSIHLVERSTRQAYWLAWLSGSIGGLLGCVGGGLALRVQSQRLGRAALPSRLVPLHS